MICYNGWFCMGLQFKSKRRYAGGVNKLGNKPSHSPNHHISKAAKLQSGVVVS